MTEDEIQEAAARCLNEVLGRGNTEADGEASDEDADALLTLLRRRYGLRLVPETVATALPVVPSVVRLIPIQTKQWRS